MAERFTEKQRELNGVFNIRERERGKRGRERENVE